MRPGGPALSAVSGLSVRLGAAHLTSAVRTKDNLAVLQVAGALGERRGESLAAGHLPAGLRAPLLRGAVGHYEGAADAEEHTGGCAESASARLPIRGGVGSF